MHSAHARPAECCAASAEEIRAKVGLAAVALDVRGAVDGVEGMRVREDRTPTTRGCPDRGPTRAHCGAFEARASGGTRDTPRASPRHIDHRLRIREALAKTASPRQPRDRRSLRPRKATRSPSHPPLAPPPREASSASSSSASVSTASLPSGNGAGAHRRANRERRAEAAPHDARDAGAGPYQRACRSPCSVSRSMYAGMMATSFRRRRCGRGEDPRRTIPR